MKNNLVNNANATNKGNLKPETLEAIQKLSAYYGVDYTILKSGILIYAGNKLDGGEYWVIKLNKSSQNKVRILFHQNHARNCKSVELPCAKEDVSLDILKSHFHKQEWDDPDLNHTFRYIANHCKKRQDINAAKKITYHQLLNMKNQQQKIAYA